MAEEFVSAAQFGEFVKRMEDRFDHANELAGERQDKMSMRFDGVEKRLDDLWKMMGVMLAGILAAAIAAVAKVFFFTG